MIRPFDLKLKKQNKERERERERERGHKDIRENKELCGVANQTKIQIELKQS